MDKKSLEEMQELLHYIYVSNEYCEFEDCGDFGIHCDGCLYKKITEELDKIDENND